MDRFAIAVHVSTRPPVGVSLRSLFWSASSRTDTFDSRIVATLQMKLLMEQAMDRKGLPRRQLSQPHRDLTYKVFRRSSYHK